MKHERRMSQESVEDFLAYLKIGLLIPSAQQSSRFLYVDGDEKLKRGSALTEAWGCCQIKMFPTPNTRGKMRRGGEGERPCFIHNLKERKILKL